MNIYSSYHVVKCLATLQFKRKIVCLLTTSMAYAVAQFFPFFPPFAQASDWHEWKAEAMGRRWLRMVRRRVVLKMWLQRIWNV